LNQHLLQQQHSTNPVNISNNSNNNISTNFTLQNSVNTAATTEISTTRGAPNITETPTITPENISTTTRITKEAKTALFLYFNSNNFTVSSKLPRHNSPGHSELDTIISKFNLQRKQAARQLTNWKESKFQIDSNASNLSTENLMVQIQNRISVTVDEIILNTISSMIPNGNDFTNNINFSLAQRSEEYHEVLKELCTKFESNTMSTEMNKLFEILKNTVNSYSMIAAKNLPKSLKTVGKNELNFVIERENMSLKNSDIWVDIFLKLFEKLTVTKARHFYGSIELLLFHSWSEYQFTKDSAPIILADINAFSVNKYSLDVLYYSAGWMLNKIERAKTEKKALKPYFESFAFKHSISREIALKDCLPISVVDYRKIYKLVYPSKSFFHFVKYIEACYVKNLTLKMMLSYQDGSLIDKIDKQLTSD